MSGVALALFNLFEIVFWYGKGRLILLVGGATGGVASAAKARIMKAFGEKRVEIDEIKK